MPATLLQVQLNHLPHPAAHHHPLLGNHPQAGFHHTLASGVRVLNLFDAVASVDPLQFRMSPPQGREVVARAQALKRR